MVAATQELPGQQARQQRSAGVTSRADSTVSVVMGFLLVCGGSAGVGRVGAHRCAPTPTRTGLELRPRPRPRPRLRLCERLRLRVRRAVLSPGWDSTRPEISPEWRVVDMWFTSLLRWLGPSPAGAGRVEVTRGRRGAPRRRPSARPVGRGSRRRPCDRPSRPRPPRTWSPAAASSRPAVGSSSRNRSARRTTARATARRLRSPPERTRPDSPTTVSRPAGDRVREGADQGRGPSVADLLAARVGVAERDVAGRWCRRGTTTPGARRRGAGARRRPRASRRSRPPMVTMPDEGSSKRSRRLSTVLFPAPVGPVSAVTCAAGKTRSTPSSTGVSS